MKNFFTRILFFVLGITLLLSCQSQAGDSRPPTVEPTPAPTVPPATATPAPSPTASPPPPTVAATPSPFPPTETPLPAPSSTATASPTEPPPVTIRHDTFPFLPVDSFSKSKTDELSGVVFHPQRKTLFAVRDNGQLIEMEPDGTVLRDNMVSKKADFEGVTVNPQTGMLYVAVEGDEIILEVDPETMAATRSIPIERIFDQMLLLAPAGNGIEGITFVPAPAGSATGTFFLVNQSDDLTGPDPSIVFEAEINTASNELYARIIRYFSVGVTDLSGLEYMATTGNLLVISDSNNLLLEVNLAGQVLATYPLPGKAQEGLALDGDGFLYLAQDEIGSPLTKYGLSGAAP